MGEKEKLSHHKKRNNFVVGERHNGNANEDKLRMKEAGIRHARGGKAPLCLLVTTNIQGKSEAGKPLQTGQVEEVEGSNIAQGRAGKFRILVLCKLKQQVLGKKGRGDGVN